jgi:uncharacterized protein (DUF433 family)
MEVITMNPDILGGTPAFRGTHVPIQTLSARLIIFFTLR